MFSPSTRTGSLLFSTSRVFRTCCRSALALLFFGLCNSIPAGAQSRSVELSGFVTDALDGLPLQGAAVYLRRPGRPGIVKGTTTNSAGRYSMRQILPGEYVVVVRFVGYDEVELSIDFSPEQDATLDVSLEQSRIDLNTIVVSASRQQEKVLDAVSAISVLSVREIQRETTPSPSSALRYVSGVDHAQTGIDRREISLRGFNNSVTGETYVLTDHRLSAIPGLALNAYGLMPIPTLDISRIEVVRGPGSALYGSGVDQGLIHFITKDPFSFPGTSVSTGGGERGLFETEFRHAGVYDEKLGYKLVAEYASGEDWELSRDDADDLDIIALDGDSLRDPDYWKYGVNGTLEYRFDDDTRLAARGGYLSQKMTLLTGIGAAQTDNFSYTYGQLRFSDGPLSAQIYLNQNDGGSSFYYNPTTLSGTRFGIVDRTMLLNGQVQYNFRLMNGREDLLIGSDYKLTMPKTEGTIHGRNESIDKVEEIGIYAQSSTILTDDVNLSVALRADYNNIARTVQLSPRAGIVFKITPTHSFRFAINRAYGAPVLSPNFLDLRIADENIRGPFMLGLQGRGSHKGFSFEQFREQHTIQYLFPDLGDLQRPETPSLFGQMLPLDRLPIHPVYEAFAANLNDALQAGALLPAPFDRLSTAERDEFAQLVNQLLPLIQGNTQGVLGIPDVNEQGYRAVSGPVDIEPLKQSLTSSIEVGYKGAVGSKVVIAADVYFAQKKNFVGPLALETPYVYLANLEEDLTNILSPLMDDFINADPELDALLQDLDLDATETSVFLARLAARGHDNLEGLAGTRVGVVQSDQQILPDGSPSTYAGGLLAYRNFGNVTLWGTDIAVDYIASDQVRIKANLSFVSDDFFDSKELEAEGNELAVALNAPTLKIGAGMEYQFPFGLSLRASGRAVNDFNVISGPFVGKVENYAVLDAGLGYDFGRQIPGLRLDMTAQNLLTFVDGKHVSTHREFIGAPHIGRMIMARILFTF